MGGDDGKKDAIGGAGGGEGREAEEILHEFESGWVWRWGGAGRGGGGGNSGRFWFDHSI